MRLHKTILHFANLTTPFCAFHLHKLLESQALTISDVASCWGRQKIHLYFSWLSSSSWRKGRPLSRAVADPPEILVSSESWPSHIVNQNMGKVRLSTKHYEIFILFKSILYHYLEKNLHCYPLWIYLTNIQPLIASKARPGWGGFYNLPVCAGFSNGWPVAKLASWSLGVLRSWDLLALISIVTIVSNLPHWAVQKPLCGLLFLQLIISWLRRKPRYHREALTRLWPPRF